MSVSNVVVLTSTEHTSTMAFKNTASMVSFVAMFVDAHDRWDVRFEMVLVHENNKVLRYRGRKLQELIEVAYGLQMAGWLAKPEGKVPTMNYLDWLDQDLVTRVYDSRQEDMDTPDWLATALVDAPEFNDESSPC